jgi:hypothetical protein
MQEASRYRKPDMLMISIQSHKEDIWVQRMWYLPLLVLSC